MNRLASILTIAAMFCLPSYACAQDDGPLEPGSIAVSCVKKTWFGRAPDYFACFHRVASQALAISAIVLIGLFSSTARAGDYYKWHQVCTWVSKEKGARVGTACRNWTAMIKGRNLFGATDWAGDPVGASYDDNGDVEYYTIRITRYRRSRDACYQEWDVVPNRILNHDLRLRASYYLMKSC